MSKPPKTVDKPIEDFGKSETRETVKEEPNQTLPTPKPSNINYLRNEKYADAWEKFFNKAGCQISDKIAKFSDIINLSTTWNFKYREMEKQKLVSYVEGMDKDLSKYIENLPFTAFNLENDEISLALGITPFDRDKASEEVSIYTLNNFYLSSPHMMVRWMNDNVAGPYLRALDLLESKNPKLVSYAINIGNNLNPLGLEKLKELERELCSLKFQYELRSYNIDTVSLLKEFNSMTKRIEAINNGVKNSISTFRRDCSVFYAINSC